MLKKNSRKTFSVPQARVAIVASEYNDEYVGPMLRAASRELKKAKVKKIKIVRVPGAYEVPVAVSALLAKENSYDAVICLGVILRGETTHAQFIGEAVTRALMTLQIKSLVPLVHEVLLLENRQQAQARCCDRKHNRGIEAAQTALKMCGIMADIKASA